MEREDQDLDRRPADPAVDLDWAYSVFKRTMQPFIEKMLGSWPEDVEHAFFSKGFCAMPMQIVMRGRHRVGRFAIIEEAGRVTVQRMYVHPQWQGGGIGTWVIKEALVLAHKVRKPLITEVFANNEPSIRFYLGKGFTKLRERIDEPITQLVILHKDTLRYYSA